MAPMHPDFLVDENGVRKAVLISISEWEQILAELEELDDIRAFDEAKAGPQDAMPFEDAVREIRADYEK